MKVGDLNLEQAQRLDQALCPTLDYFDCLFKRIQYHGFPSDDSLWVAAVKARDELHDLVGVVRIARNKGQNTTAERQRRQNPFLISPAISQAGG